MADSEPEGGERLIAGRYRVQDVLGRGGMGAVYRVHDARGDRVLALKRGSGRDARKAQKRKALLEREYHTLAQLAHPSIIEVYDYGVDQDGPYYTMELLDGADLDARGKVPWKIACQLLCDVASSLAILHSRGLLHRDVSARNVRCTADGRAKLLDFGAMTSMGVVKEVIGTPPFVAPEVLQMQMLDARADLFSLGALGYRLLTGRHAFAARKLADLRDAWRSPPTSPARIEPELPSALSQLILQLLSLDRNARPQSAAEVMQRLCAVAGLPMQESVEVSRAYLSTPTLVGREKALLSLRKRMLSLVRGDGGCVLVEGLSGTGRSRLLDAGVLEGKLLGASVLRADASDGASGPWGVARTIGAQLLELMPEEAIEATRLSRTVVGHVIEGLRTGHSGDLVEPERSLLLRELRDFVLTLAREQRLLLVIDDVDRIDEPSAALLAALAHKVERNPLLLLLATEGGGTESVEPSLKLMREVATVVTLAHHGPEETEALMRSVFGDVAHLSLVAGRVHALSQGNPRATMELAQHLCDRGLARYEAGSWSLPSELAEHDLPSTLAGSLEARLRSLGDDARELVEALALADGDPLALADYAPLTSHADPVRVFRALDELVAARVLVADAERYRFSQRGFLAVLAQRMPNARAVVLHGRIADLLDRPDANPHRRAHHLLCSEREREAVELLCNTDLQAKLPPLELSERALQASERLGLPRRAGYALRNAILGRAPMVFDFDAFRRTLPHVLDQLERDSGLRDYADLAQLPEPERLGQALTRAQARFDATPEHDRVCSPIEAIIELARCCTNLCSIAMQALDLEFLESLPKLAPLTPLSPALQMVSTILESCKEMLAGRTLVARKRYVDVLARLEQPDHAGFDPTYYRGIKHAVHYLLGLVEASVGAEAAETHAQLLEADREHRVNAWRVRVALHLNRGDLDEARKCQRRAELLQLQESDQQRYVGSSVGFELTANAQLGDLIGVRRAMESIAQLAVLHQGWRPVHALAQASYRWLQGDLQGALDVLSPTLDACPPGRHAYYCFLAATHIGVLCDLGRLDESVERAREYLAIVTREQLAPTDRRVHLAAGVALGRRGDHAEAVLVLDGGIEAGRRNGMEGLGLGALHEARARVALLMNDRAAFEQHAEACVTEYGKSRSAALAARFALLMEEASEDAELRGRASTLGSLLPAAQSETGFETVQSRMLECVDPNDRARCALTILLQSMDGITGYLYGVSEDHAVSLLAALPEPPPNDGLSSWLCATLREELDARLHMAATVTSTGSAEGSEEAPSQVAARFTDATGRCFEPYLLIAENEGARRIAAMLALEVQAGPRSPVNRELFGEIASQLLEHGDVSGIAV